MQQAQNGFTLINTLYEVLISWEIHGQPQEKQLEIHDQLQRCKQTMLAYISRCDKCLSIGEFSDLIEPIDPRLSTTLLHMYPYGTLIYFYKAGMEGAP